MSSRLSSRVVLAACVMTLAVSSITVSHAARSAGHLRVTTVTFRVHAADAPGRNATFWVAYGPLAGEWGLVRLMSRGQGLYTASRTLPADLRTTFSYLVGRGVLSTKLGPAPGNPVTVIRSVGPVTAARMARSPVEWHAPVG